MGSVNRRGLRHPWVVRLAVLLLIAASLVVLIVLSPAVLGQEDEIHIVSQAVESDFPNNITFKLTATSPDPIEEIRVFLKPVGSDRSTYGYLDIQAGRQVSGEHIMTTGTGPSYKPPGTVIRYSFEIRDAAGRVLRTDDKEFLYMDNSADHLQWKEISEGLLTVYYYGDFVEKRARTVLETSQKTMKLMGRVLGIKPQDPIKIVAYSNYRDMARALPFRSQAVREELQTEGQAYASERVLLVLSSESDVIGVASHEFTHILVAEAAGRGISLVPAWLNEGLAEYGNLDPTPHYDWALNYAIFTRRLKPLWYLDTFTGQPNDILIAYGQGRSAVRYLIDGYGEEKMTELMRAFREALSVDEALKKVYGFDQYGLDSQWRLALGLAPLPSPEELDQEVTATPGPTPTTRAEATPVPTPEEIFTPAAVAEASPEPPAVSDEGRRTSRSCSGAPSGEGASLPLDIAVLALLAGPFFALNARWGLSKTSLVHRLRLIRRVKKGLRKFQDGGGR